MCEAGTLFGTQRLSKLKPSASLPEEGRNGETADVRLAVKRLTLTDFRCYGHLRLDVDPGPVVLTGPNGAGKTNLLEAISFLAPGRGLRRARLGEAARSRDAGGDGSWAVAARALTRTGTVDIGTGFEGPDAAGRHEQRLIRIDGEPIKRQARLAEDLSVHWLTPQMDRLFVEGALARRRFLDRLVFCRDPAHARRINAYDQALRERARLLKENTSPDSAWLTALEDTMATHGVAVAAARVDLAHRLDNACAEGFEFFPGAGVTVEGELEEWLSDGPALACEDRLRERLAADRSRDASERRTAAGPHRSDLRVRHRTKDQAAEMCSTGEQKALLVALVLGNAKMRADEHGAVPVLLLDEIAAHLDVDRRAALFDAVVALGAQVWMAGTDRMLFEPLFGRAQFFRVEDATVTVDR